MGSFVTGSEHYAEVSSAVGNVFDVGARLPDQVFKRVAGDYLFCEFDIVLSPEIWPALTAMARWHGDDRVELLALDPSRDNFYVPDYGVHPAISLPVDTDSDGYWEAIGYEPGGDVMGSIAISANVVAIVGPSGNWGCWGERDAEVAVFSGFPSAAGRAEWRDRFGPFLEAPEALDSYLSMAFRGRTVPDEYAGRLTLNYGCRSDNSEK
ncbi:hypothetical protein RCO28_32310 [Streptomyces sp. LHD-70]|uniref:hypothetical protein n=1 Tax=Streptomyces sp. LHD-70 TaxID=3072140 RepID=UPI00280CF9F5|nr:hypothetical protein [Streptomyces sp. LHD-70]MDQ8707122.1 hypothetical protein [Streptomyces sp. LHD-70]